MTIKQQAAGKYW